MARATGPFIKVVAKTNFHGMREFVDVVTYYGQRKTMQKLGHSLQHEINRYVPVGKTHHLQRSYTILTGREHDRGPWFTLAYLNTESAPYTMYQYYGEVWGKNYPTWSANLTLTKDPGDMQIRWKHSGWISKKGEKKENTHRPLGIRHSFRNKYGKLIYITGYTKRKPKPHARWVEWYCEQHKFTIWKDTTGQQIVKDILAKYKMKRNT